MRLLTFTVFCFRSVVIKRSCYQKNKDFKSCFLLDTDEFFDGDYSLGLVASDGVNTTQTKINVKFNNRDFGSGSGGTGGPGTGGTGPGGGTGGPGGLTCTTVSPNLRVRLTNPGADSTVSGAVPLTVEASGAAQTVYYLIKAEGSATETIFTAASPPFAATLYTNNYRNGNYIVKAVAQGVENGQPVCSSTSDTGEHAVKISINNRSLPTSCISTDSRVTVSLVKPVNPNIPMSGNAAIEARLNNTSGRAVKNDTAPR